MGKEKPGNFASQVKEILNYTFKSGKRQGSLFLFCHKVCKRVSLLAKITSFQKYL